MLEGQVAFYLNKYLGSYVYGLDTQSLKISVFKGDVQLNNLHLKPEALNALNLPITVKAGLLGSLTLKVNFDMLLLLGSLQFLLLSPDQSAYTTACTCACGNPDTSTRTSCRFHGQASDVPQYWSNSTDCTCWLAQSKNLRRLTLQKTR